MKKIVSIILIICFLALSFPASVFAKDIQESISYFEDGSYTVVSIQDSDSLFMKVLQNLRSTKTKTITAKHYDSNNELEWTASLTGTFTYNGVTASCTSVSKSTTIYDNAWRCTASSCSKSGATATGDFTFKRYVLLVPVQTINQNITMTCDPNGNIT